MNVSRSQLKAKDNTEHTNPTSYSWSILRLALIKISTHKIQELVKVAGIELQGSCNISSIYSPSSTKCSSLYCLPASCRFACDQSTLARGAEDPQSLAGLCPE